MMDRDRRLTGFLRGQSDKPLAPAGFELNNPWRVSCGPASGTYEHQRLIIFLGREENVIEGALRMENKAEKIPGAKPSEQSIVQKPIINTAFTKICRAVGQLAFLIFYQAQTHS